MPNLLNSQNRFVSDYEFDDGANGAQTNTSFATTQVSSSDVSVDMGTTERNFNLNIAITAIDNTTDDEVYTIVVESNEASGFTGTSTHKTEFAFKGGPSAGNTDLTTKTLKFSNKFRYVRVQQKGAGTTPSIEYARIWASPAE